MPDRPAKSRVVLKGILKGAIAVGLIYIMFRWFEHRQVYWPSAHLDTTGAALGRAWEDVTFAAADGVRLNGWYFPVEGLAPLERPVILLCHGNAGNISHRLQHVSALLELEVSVFVFDYRGYGRSEGRPDEAGTYRDAEGAYDWLRERGHSPEQIIALGESLGGGVVSELALQRPVKAVVLLTTFTSIPELGAELFPWLPVRWLATIRYDTRAKLPRIPVPVLIVHSREDTLVSFAHAEANFAAANEPKWLVELEGDHNDFLWVNRRVYLEAWAPLLRLP